MTEYRPDTCPCVVFITFENNVPTYQDWKHKDEEHMHLDDQPLIDTIVALNKSFQLPPDATPEEIAQNQVDKKAEYDRIAALGPGISK